MKSPPWVSTSAAADLLRPSAEEASPDDQTSDALCRRKGAPPSALRSTLDRARLIGVLAGCESHGDALSARLQARHGGFKAMGTESQDAFRWFDLRPRDRSRLARAPFDVRSRLPRTLSPTANRLPSSMRGPPRQADPGLLREPKGTLCLPGKMRLPNVCNRPTPRAPRRSLDARITPSPAFAGDRGFHATHRAEALAESVIEWSFA